MTRHSIAGALAAAVLIGACDSPQAVTPAPTGPYTISSTNPWAGSTVLIRSADFSAHGHGAFVWLGTDSLPLTRVDDTTMSATIPDTLGGEFAPQVVVDGITFPLQPITVAGYVSYREYEPQLAWDIYAWPRTGPAVVMGGSATGLTFIDLDAGTVTTEDSIIDLHSIHGPGPTYRDSVFLLAPEGGSLEAWRPLPAAALVDTILPPLSCYCRQAMQLGPNALYIGGGGRGWTVLTRTDSTQPYTETLIPTGAVSETEGAYLSPTHDRATITVDNSDGGIPVFNAPSGTLAYSVTELNRSTGVDFSADGQLLALVGQAPGQQFTGRVLLLNAASGAVLGDTTTAKVVFGVALDPVRPLLYVGEYRVDGLPSILVIDRNTFHLLGKMSVPGTAPACNTGCYKAVIALSSANALYLVAAYNPPGTQAYRFTLP